MAYLAYQYKYYIHLLLIISFSLSQLIINFSSLLIFLELYKARTSMSKVCKHTIYILTLQINCPKVIQIKAAFHLCELLSTRFFNVCFNITEEQTDQFSLRKHNTDVRQTNILSEVWMSRQIKL